MACTLLLLKFLQSTSIIISELCMGILKTYIWFVKWICFCVCLTEFWNRIWIVFCYELYNVINYILLHMHCYHIVHSTQWFGRNVVINRCEKSCLSKWLDMNYQSITRTIYSWAKSPEMLAVESKNVPCIAHLSEHILLMQSCWTHTKPCILKMDFGSSMHWN